MKVLIIHHCDSWGGAGVSLRDVCRMLKDEHEITVCLPHLNSEVKKELEKVGGIEFVSIDGNMGMIPAYNGGPKLISRTFVKSLLRIKKSSVELKKILKQTKYDLIIHNSITLSWAAVVANRMKIRNLMYIRETKVNNIGYHLCRFLINRYCDGIAFISDHDQKIMNSKLKNQAVIYDCLDFETYRNDYSKNESFDKFGLEASKFNVLYVGGADELKGYSVVTRAIRDIKDELVHIVVAGAVSDDKKVISDNVTYVGKVIDMPLLYSACDVLIFPSTKGHQARPVFEAGALGVPVIVSDFPETASEVQNGVNGFVFEAGNSEMLTEKIGVLFRSPELCKKLGEQNYKNCKEKHDYIVVKAKLLDYIEKIVQ